MNASTQFTLRFRPGLRLTDRVFGKLCAANPELKLERTAREELVVVPTGSETAMRNAAVTAQVVYWAEVDGSGVAFDSSAGFTLPNGAIRSPDSSWITRVRWRALPARAAGAVRSALPRLRRRTAFRAPIEKQSCARR